MRTEQPCFPLRPQAYRKHLGTTGQMGSQHSATTLTTLTPKLARTSLFGAHEAPCGCGLLWDTHFHPPSSVTLIPTEPVALRPLPKISMWLAPGHLAPVPAFFLREVCLGTWDLAALCS